MFEMKFSVNFVMLDFRKLILCHGSFENVAGIDGSSVAPLPAAKQRTFNHDI